MSNQLDSDRVTLRADGNGDSAVGEPFEWDLRDAVLTTFGADRDGSRSGATSVRVARADLDGVEVMFIGPLPDGAPGVESTEV